MLIRPAEHSDLESLSNLFDAYRVFYQKTSDVSGAENFLRERLEQNDSKIFVAESAESNLVGFTQLYPLFSSTRMQKLWLLNDLYVKPEFRGKGISILLIEKAKELVKESGACGFFLETEKSNTIGNQLYKKVGMQLNTSSNFYEWTS